MSKSVGNVTTIRDVVDQWGAEAFLLFLMTGHWRRPIDFSAETLSQAKARAQTFRNAFMRAEAPSDASEWVKFSASLDNDFDTPQALAIMHQWAATGQLRELRRALEIFGLAQLSHRPDVPCELVAMSARRDDARRGRDFALADQIREDIEAAGWEIRDSADGASVLLPRGDRRVMASPAEPPACPQLE